MPSYGLFDNGLLYHKYEEIRREGTRLGRNLWLDARSLAHMVENSAEEMGRPFKSQAWQRVVTILDQGQLGSCTGNAGTGALGTQPFYDAVGSWVLPSPNDAGPPSNSRLSSTPMPPSSTGIPVTIHRMTRVRPGLPYAKS